MSASSRADSQGREGPVGVAGRGGLGLPAIGARIPDRVVFDKLLQVLVFGCAYERIAGHTCPDRTLRRRRDGIDAGIMAELERIARYVSGTIRQILTERGLNRQIAERGKPLLGGLASGGRRSAGWA